MISAVIMPHPPIARAMVGRGEEKKIQSTLDAYRAAARQIAQDAPETIGIISPHNISFSGMPSTFPPERSILTVFPASALLLTGSPSPMTQNCGMRSSGSAMKKGSPQSAAHDTPENRTTEA